LGAATRPSLTRRSSQGSGTVWITTLGRKYPNVPFGRQQDSGFGVQYGSEGLRNIYLRVIFSRPEVHIFDWRDLQRPIGSRQRKSRPIFLQPSPRASNFLKAAGRSTRKKPNYLSVPIPVDYVVVGAGSAGCVVAPAWSKTMGERFLLGAGPLRRQYADPHARCAVKIVFGKSPYLKRYTSNAPARARGASRRINAKGTSLAGEARVTP